MLKKIVLVVVILLMFNIENYSQMRLSLQGGLAVPTADFADDIGNGFGGSATFEYLTGQLGVTGSIGYYGFDLKDDPPAGIDYSLTIVPINIGLRYYFSRGTFNPYAGAELGLSILNESVTEDNRETSNSESKFGLNPMFGFRTMISSNVDFDMTIKYHIITTDPSTTFFGIHAGLNFGL